MKAPRILVVFTLHAAIFTFAQKRADAQADDFNDGNSAGWTELEPLAGFDVMGTFSFPGGNSYRMQAGPSPDEGQLGQSRIGALREDASYTDFYQFVDIVDHDEALDQNIDMLARVKEPGLGSLDGYGVTYNPTDGAMFLTVITNEEGNNIADTNVFVDAGTPVRMVFQGKGDLLKFEIFTLDDLENAVASIEINDATYSSGNSGLFVVTDGADPAKPTDCTFDNYFAAATKPFEFRIVSVEIDGNEIVFEFLSQPDQSYTLWHSGDLKTWDEVTDGIKGALGNKTTYRTPKHMDPRHFYEFRLQ